jgi:2-oxoisovalerate dehydrogenase E1 component alpha subunit
MEPWRQVDPIGRFKDFLIAQGHWDAERDAALVGEIEQRFRAAVVQAEGVSAPPIESMFDDVYEKLPWHLVEQRAQLVAGPRAPGAH